MRICAGGQTLSGGGLPAFEKRLCNQLQIGLPVCVRPFELIADLLKSSEAKVISRTKALIKNGVIRRLGVVINWRALGMTSTLVTAHIEQKDLRRVASAVNKLKGVSHNYLREHYYNLWFTLRADSQKDIDGILKKLSKRFRVDFHSLPVIRPFKLDVRFDALSGGRRLLPEDRRRRTEDGKQTISGFDKRILERLQGGLKAVKQPFDCISKDKFEVYDGLLHISEMIDEGVISRLGAIVNQHKLGFTANAMFVCKVAESRVVAVGEALSKLQIVSHCYQRPTFKGWPYNLFAMMHGPNLAEIREVAEKFVKKHRIKQWDLLATAEKLKK
jgi:DNA-binding Lrp family transcriptional regulator